MFGRKRISRLEKKVDDLAASIRDHRQDQRCHVTQCAECGAVCAAGTPHRDVDPAHWHWGTRYCSQACQLAARGQVACKHCDGKGRVPVKKTAK